MGTAEVGKHGGRDWRPAPALLTACRISRSGGSADYRCAGTMLTGNSIKSPPSPLAPRRTGYSTRTGVSPAQRSAFAVARCAEPPIGVPGPRTKSG